MKKKSYTLVLYCNILYLCTLKFNTNEYELYTII
nr:MAG TPA: hypothetical protein [Caudoviricetes sp.]